jgi:hypothetical protein
MPHLVQTPVQTSSRAARRRAFPLGFERLHRLTTRFVAAVVSSWPARYLSPGREERRTSPHANAARDRPVADLKQT